MNSIALSALLLLLSQVSGDMPTCLISGISVQQVKNGTGISADGVQQHLSDSLITFVDPAAQYWSCVDGRDTNNVLGTPGGDSGEFLAALSIYSKHGGNLTTEAQVISIFRQFMAQLPNERFFYMHTDEHALQHLEQDVATKTDLINGFDLMAVPAQYQSQVMPLLIDPNNIGCGHLKLIVKNPDQYDVTYSLSTAFIKAFYDYLWNHENWKQVKLHREDLAVLIGSHNEGAVLQVYSNTSAGSACASVVPAIPPSNPDNSFFVNYPVAVSAIRSQIVKFFSTLPGSIPADSFRKELDALAAKQLGLTVGYLAGTLPVYSVTISFDAPPVPPPAKPSTAWIGPVVIVIILIVIIGGSALAYFIYTKVNKPVVKKTVVHTSDPNKVVELEEL